jgi:hypothetical protein
MPGKYNILYLGKNGDTLQVDGEGPEDLHGGELVVEHQGEQRARTQQEFDPECTMKSSVHGVHLWFILSYLNVHSATENGFMVLYL